MALGHVFVYRTKKQNKSEQPLRPPIKNGLSYFNCPGLSNLLRDLFDSNINITLSRIFVYFLTNTGNSSKVIKLT